MKPRANCGASSHAQGLDRVVGYSSNTILGFSFVLLVMFAAIPTNVRGQNPVLPPTNLGLANFYDGLAGKPGFYLQGYGQVFQTRAFYDQAGKRSPSDLKVNSELVMNQLLYLS